MRGLAVIGTDTGVGKTFVSAAIMSAAADNVVYWKPVQTGVEGPGEPDDDSSTVQRMARLEDRRVVAPVYRFPEPASPHHAAALAGGDIALDVIRAACRVPPFPGARWVVEGVGGLLVPLNDHVLLPALLRDLALPVLLVASTRLGTINHTLLTLRQCQAEGLDVIGVVWNGPADPSAETALEAHGGAPVVGHVPLLAGCTYEALTDVGSRLLAHPAVGGRLHD
jgi:dethiobiotin synthetase